MKQAEHLLLPPRYIDGYSLFHGSYGGRREMKKVRRVEQQNGKGTFRSGGGGGR
jgi:hypothetical protein